MFVVGNISQTDEKYLEESRSEVARPVITGLSQAVVVWRLSRGLHTLIRSINCKALSVEIFEFCLQLYIIILVSCARLSP